MLAVCLTLISLGGINAVEVSSVQDIPTVEAASVSSSYLVASKNCQVKDPAIRSKAAAITRGTSNPYTKAVKIFNWVRDNLQYKFYYNTRYGAVKALKYKQGNCVDHAHLIVAMSRASGIPARYGYGKVKFTNGLYTGHVWAELYVNGKWTKADATSSKNSFGTTRSWARGSTQYTFASLPI